MTLGEDVQRQLDAAASLPEAITVLVKAFGSVDKLAAELGTGRGAVIGWRKHGRFPTGYADQLRGLGVPETLLMRATPEEVRRRLLAVEAEVLAIRELLQ